MNERTKSGAAWRCALASFLVAPAVALLGACDSGAGVDVDEQRYIEEAFDFTVETDIQYGLAVDENGAEEALLLDLYAPTNDGEGPRPAIVWLHGGSFQFGAKADMAAFAERFARRGYISVSANYRLREGAVFDYTDPDDPLAEAVKRDAQHDAQAAVRWLRANASSYRIDPDLIFVAGYSAGATTALRVAAHPDDPGTSGNPDPPSDVAAAVAISGSLDPGVLEAAGSPTLLIHGEADTKVSFADVQAACAAVEGCELVPVPEVDHDLIEVATDVVVTETSRFLLTQVTVS